MSQAFRCPECGASNHVFEALNEGLLAISGEPSIEAVLKRIVEVARALVHASFGALGVPGPDAGFAHFITSGLAGDSPRVLPTKDGVFGAALTDATPFAATNVQEDPRFEGWPPGYPDLKSFLAVPIVAQGEIVGSFYLANENTWGFAPDDQSLVGLLAAHAGLAIKNAALFEQSRELSVVQERNRLARELHDSVTQSLFSMRLAAETAGALLEEDAARARVQIEILKELSRHATSEMRSLIFELRPLDVETEGLVGTLRKHVEVLGRVHPVQIELHAEGSHSFDAREEKELFRIAQEALHNSIKHSRATQITVDVDLTEDKLRVSVTDDGDGFDLASAQRQPRRLGLVTMQERAHSIGAALSISSEIGRGTVMSVELVRE